jgi:hypothetical protein
MEVCLDICCKLTHKTSCTFAAYVFTPLWSSVISLTLGYWTLQTYAFYCYFLVVFSGFLACEQWNEVLTGIEQRFSNNKFWIFFDQKFGKVFLFLVLILLISLFFGKSLSSFLYHKLEGRKKKTDAEEDGFSPSPSTKTRIWQLIMIGTLWLVQEQADHDRPRWCCTSHGWMLDLLYYLIVGCLTLLDIDGENPIRGGRQQPHQSVRHRWGLQSGIGFVWQTSLKSVYCRTCSSDHWVQAKYGKRLDLLWDLGPMVQCLLFCLFRCRTCTSWWTWCTELSQIKVYTFIYIDWYI